ncbi:hypothetical protein [Christiangramia sp. SM2212]|uniref:Uncharacterized protein n=1 Tax=Christiangramia sediminicola TaxID=3073267 RepID=A0ABU1ET69_9FLAO|nr:hypothetical protein [Christiangramia sp. SM2212]MDR5591174.1 hypothetical protein [Christiangramia sp. SM2212]
MQRASLGRLGHNAQFQLSIPLTLPAMLGRNITFPSRNRELSPLNRNSIYSFDATSYVLILHKRL